jgi:DDE superfamily endonuclease
MRGLDPRRLVSVDEAGVTTDMVRRHARAPRGQRAYGPTGPPRPGRALAAAAGVAAAMAIGRATDTAVSTALLDQVLVPELVRAKPGAVVGRDDLSPHEAPAVRRRLEAAGLELVLLPRYAPDLNPIEPMWAKVKAALRARRRRARSGRWRRPSPALWTVSRPPTPAACSALAATPFLPTDPQTALVV